MDLYCTKWSLQFGNLTIYNMHLSTVHKKNVEIKQKASCNILEKVSLQYENCDKNFSTRSILNKPEGKKPFKCDICDYSCSQIGNLEKHVASVHENKK